ncbi:CheR family methyltransferase [Methanospirillum stamsii]|uniref:CheR-type methyltransferase domain-containing protein n=1 Tax=Methanospirillum stamsii TaxID=1277351 RepID=A0A2V2MWP4_9EURY|nr:CheR family methyltransferase [Methanospirillum stamsii]PWR71809.1 hypothetical protein DLD82_13090 [Methanospirillum stamsii]
MNEFVDSTIIQTIKDLIISHTGILFNERHEQDLVRHIIRTCEEIDVPVDSCIHKLSDKTFTQHFLEKIIKRITIGETYFFRDKNLFLYLKDILLPDLIRERRKTNKLYLRIWSAACSSGEEPYSLAILLRYLLLDIADWDIYLLATDINQGMIDRALTGEYSRWSFRDEPLVSIGQYFTPTPDNRLKIDECIKSMVRFECRNLIQDSFMYHSLGPSSLDIILCRNVLMYFSPSQAQGVVLHLAETLRNDGFLIVSPQEIGIINNPYLNLFHHGQVFLHVKGKKQLKEAEIHINSPKPESVSDFHQIEFLHNEHEDSFYELTSEKKYPELGFVKPSKLPANPELEKNLFDALITENRLDDAGEIVNQKGFLSGYGDVTREMGILIKAYAGLGDYEKALGWSDRLISQDPLNPKPYLIKAAVLDENGFRDHAIQLLRQSLYADPDYLPAHLSIAGIYMNLGKSDLARHHYSIAIQILETMPEIQVLEETEGIPADKMKDMIRILLKE